MFIEILRLVALGIGIHLVIWLVGLILSGGIAMVFEKHSDGILASLVALTHIVDKVFVVAYSIYVIVFVIKAYI